MERKVDKIFILLVVFFIFLFSACSSDNNNQSEADFKHKVYCEGLMCIIQPQNSSEPLKFEALTFNPKALKEHENNNFESSVIRIYYKDEERKKIEFISIKNGNIITTLFFDDSIGSLQAASSKLLGYEPFFILSKNDSNRYFLK